MKLYRTDNYNAHGGGNFEGFFDKLSDAREACAYKKRVQVEPKSQEFSQITVFETEIYALKGEVTLWDLWADSEIIDNIYFI